MEYGNLVYGNLAYKEEPELKVKKAREVAKAPKQKLNLRVIFFAVLISFAAYFMISKQVAVFESDKEISRLSKELETLKSTEVQKTFELEQSVDLAFIEKEATTRLNMQRPDQNQKVYVNVTGEDVTEITSGDAESVKNRVSSIAESVKKNIIGIFSIG